MLTQQRLRLDDVQRGSPETRLTGEDDEEETVERRQARAGDLPPEDDELLAQESILGDQGRCAPGQIGHRSNSKRACGQGCSADEALVDRTETRADDAFQLHEQRCHYHALASPSFLVSSTSPCCGWFSWSILCSRMLP